MGDEMSTVWPKAIVDACGRYDVRDASLVTLDVWAYGGVPQRVYSQGSERLDPGGGWTWSYSSDGDGEDESLRAVTRESEETSELILRNSMERYGLSRETFFVFSLLRAVLGHIYIWKMMSSKEDETVVPDPVYLFGSWRKLYGKDESPSSVSIADLREVVRQVPLVCLGDVDHPDDMLAWHRWAKPWTMICKRF